MRIVVDLQSCQTASQLGGIGRYSLDLLKSMLVYDRKNEYIVVLNGNLDRARQSLTEELLKFMSIDSILYFETPKDVSYFNNRSRSTKAAELLREKFISDLAPDVIHVASMIEGLGDEAVTSCGHLDIGCPVAATLYDLIPLHNSGRYLADYIARQHYLDKISHLNRTDLLLSISEYSAKDFRDIFPSYNGHIVSIRGGIDPKFKKSSDKLIEYDVFLKKNNIKEFLLYTASFDQRKNQAGLIKAFSSLSERIQAGLKLVFVGNGWPKIYEDLLSYSRALGVPEGAVIFAGRVSDELLIKLYSECRLFVFPSFAEGLGLPVVEAMACGAPTIASNTTCLPQIVGNDSYLFDPANPHEMSMKIDEVLRIPAMRERMVTAGVEQAATFTWEISAQQAVSALEEIVGHTRRAASTGRTRGADEAILASVIQKMPEGLGHDELDAFLGCLRSNEIESDYDWAASAKLRIGWVSTWASRCGIATYSEHLTNEASDVVVKLAPVNPEREVTSTPRDLLRCWTLGPSGDVSGIIAAVIAERLDAVVIQINYGLFDFREISALIEALYMASVSVAVTLHSTIDPPQNIVVNSLEILAPSLKLADYVFVHSANDVRRLSGLGVNENVTRLPHGILSIPGRLENQTKKSDTKRLVGSYGFFLPHKGLKELVKAAATARDCGRPFDLILVNGDYGDQGGVSASEITQAKQLIDELGLQHNVTLVTEFLEDERSLAILSMMDLIVFPYQSTAESASGAVRFGLTIGKPVAVTPVAIFDDVRSITHSLPGLSSNDLARGICDLLDAIESKADHVRQVEDRADVWRSLTSYNKVMASMTRKLKRAVNQSWNKILQPSITSLPTQVGVRTPAGIRTSGRQGSLIYGPYARVNSGRYRLLLEGHVVNENGNGHAVLKLSYNASNKIIDRVELDLSKRDLVIDRKFVLRENVNDLEVVIDCSSDASFIVNHYIIYGQTR